MKYTKESDEKEQRMLDTLLNLKDMKVLEIGCGSGDYTFKIAPISKEIISIDPSEKAIKAAIENCPPDLKNKITFKVAYGEKLPFKDNSFNIVFLALVFHELPTDKRPKVLNEIHRVVKNGGKVCFIETTLEDPMVNITDYVFGSNHSQLLKQCSDIILRSIEDGSFRKIIEKDYWIEYIWDDIQDAYNDMKRYYSWWSEKEFDKRKIKEKLDEILGSRKKDKPLKLPLKLKIIILEKI